MAKDTGVKKKTKRPTALKRDDQNAKKRLINKAFKSKLKTTIRRFQESLVGDEKESVVEKLNSAYSMLDKAVKRHILKINAASRKKSRLAASLAAKFQ